ncbi:MAG: hypothetical protein K6E55_10770 [Thermoguttaceae bacterium]|nr:hypothetical protein [Thermoguttaceae bacterium]
MAVLKNQIKLHKHTAPSVETIFAGAGISFTALEEAPMEEKQSLYYKAELRACQAKLEASDAERQATVAKMEWIRSKLAEDQQAESES